MDIDTGIKNSNDSVRTSAKKSNGTWVIMVKQLLTVLEENQRNELGRCSVSCEEGGWGREGGRKGGREGGREGGEGGREGGRESTMERLRETVYWDQWNDTYMANKAARKKELGMAVGMAKHVRGNCDRKQVADDIGSDSCEISTKSNCIQMGRKRWHYWRHQRPIEVYMYHVTMVIIKSVATNAGHRWCGVASSMENKNE